ncbi:ImmA/IrrE family metallo-endopeptidase [Leuconostoc gelidum subsp. gasicomitatum]|uniref:ImmA/IrrE family metallo-endopeptidase n=1 Tax=Leuconostoc gasicomitatum TaxID=115778 RepID=UPI001CC480A6|nr:ImmA/IrrE family metallo-endopeptidase [Leuconostoc gasicomitatum]MBZ5985094.1 ImmA/IrrE family metallo-endopeptidase [Leuconostoc gasicomitatum]
MSYDFKSNASREYLENIIDLNHITIIHLSGTAYDPDVVNIQKKAIIINNNYQSNFSYEFRIAHELAHLLCTTSSENYNLSLLTKNDIEKQANIDGIQLLINFYFSEIASGKLRWNYRFQFISTFGLGPLTHLVEKILNPIKNSV